MVNLSIEVGIASFALGCFGGIFTVGLYWMLHGIAPNIFEGIVRFLTWYALFAVIFFIDRKNRKNNSMAFLIGLFFGAAFISVASLSP